EERAAHRGQRVVDAWRDDGVHRSRHDAVPLETANRDREHALADPLDDAEQLGEAARVHAEHADDVDGPLVSDAVEHLAGAAMAAQADAEPPRRSGRRRGGYLRVRSRTRRCPLARGLESD